MQNDNEFHYKTPSLYIYMSMTVIFHGPVRKSNYGSEHNSHILAQRRFHKGGGSPKHS